MLLIYPFNALSESTVRSFGFEAYRIPESKNIFPISFSNYSTYDADIFRMILMADLEQVRELKTEREGIEASISKIEKHLKTNKTILVGDVRNIPLLNIHRDIITSKRAHDEFRKDLEIISDKVEGENDRGFREALNDDLMLVSKRDNTPKDLKNIDAYFWSNIDNNNFLVVTDNESRALIDSINNPTIINSIFEKGFVDSDNKLILDEEVLKSLKDEVYENDIYLDKDMIISKIENLNNNVFVDTSQIYADIFEFVSTKVEREMTYSEIQNSNNNLQIDKPILNSGRISENVILTHREKLKALISRDGEIYVMKKMFFVKPPGEDDDDKIRIPITTKREIKGELDRGYGEIESIQSIKALRESYKDVMKLRESILDGVKSKFEKISIERSIRGIVESLNNPLFVDDKLIGSEETPYIGKLIDEEFLGISSMDLSSILMSEDFLGTGRKELESILRDDEFLGFSREQIESILADERLIAEIKNKESKIEKNILGDREEIISKIEKTEFTAEVKNKEGLLERLSYISSLVKKDKISILNDLYYLASKEYRDSILEDGLEESTAGLQSYIMEDMILGNRLDEKDSETLNILWESIKDVSNFSVMLDDYINSERMSLKDGLLDEVLKSNKVLYEVQIHEVEMADRVMKDRVVSFIDDLEATKEDKESVLEDIFAGILKDKISTILDEEEILGDRILEKNSLLNEYHNLSNRISDKLGGLLDLDIFGDKYHEGEITEELLGVMDRSWDSALCELKISAVQINKFSVLQKILDSASKIKMEAVLKEDIKNGSKNDLEAHIEAFDYLSDRILEKKSKLMRDDVKGIKPTLSTEVEEQILGDREKDKDSIKIDEILNVDKVVDKGIIVEEVEGILVDKFAKMEKDILGDSIEYEGKKVDGLRALRSLDEKRSELLNNYRWAIGCNSPEEFFPDADVNNPNVDLDTDDPSEDKDHPGRWYDGPKTPMEVLKELLIELKERDQGVTGHTADETAQMIKDIINEIKKHHVHANSDEFKEIINWINALIDSELHNVCELKERIFTDSIIDYRKDWQNPMEPEGKWKDSEWVGNDTPPEEAGVGNWINVDLTKPSGATKEMLDAVLSKNGGLLSEISQACLDAEKRYGVNAIYIASHAIWESGWGRSQIAKDKNNLFGYGAYDWSPYESAWTFRNKAHCIDVVAKHVADDYLTPKGPYWGGAPTLKAMNKFYATDIAWANGIGSLMRQFYGGPPPNGLLAGYNQEPYTKWYRYEEPEIDAQGWKMLHPEAPVPNFCLHSPDDLKMDEVSGVYIKKNSKTGGTIKFRAKVVNGDSPEPSDDARFKVWYDDVSKRPNSGTVPESVFEKPYDRFMGYTTFGENNEEPWYSQFKTEGGEYVTNGAYNCNTEMNFRYKCLKDTPAELVLGRGLKSGKEVPSAGNIIGYSEKYLVREDFRGTPGKFGSVGRFESSKIQSSGLKYFRGWGFHSGYTGTTLQSVANAEWSYDVDMGELDGYLKLLHLSWCNPTDNGIQILIDEEKIWSYAGTNGIEDPSKVSPAKLYRKERISIPKGKHKITIRVKNNMPGMHTFDGFHLIKKVPVYSQAPEPGKSISKMMLEVHWSDKLNTDYVLLKRVVWEGEVKLEREIINIPAKPSGYIMLRIIYQQKQKDNSDKAIINHVAIYEEGGMDSGITSNSTLKYYADDVLMREFEALPSWQEATFPIEKGVTKHMWEITQKNKDGKDYALLDDVIISGMEVTKEEYWDCPENTGEDLLDKIIDWLDKKKPLPEEPKNINFKVWLYT